MPLLPPPDSHHLAAALGWLELGCPSDALTELEKISPDWLGHPAVLEIRWAVHSQAKDWEAALPVARALTQAAPDRADGWLHQSYALRRVAGGGLQAAFDLLRPAADRFPEDWLIAYNLACYSCQLQQPDVAGEWLLRASAKGDKKQIIQMALDDPDLLPLRDQIRNFAGGGKERA